LSQLKSNRTIYQAKKYIY